MNCSVLPLCFTSVSKLEALTITHFTMHCYRIRVRLGIPQITQARPWASNRAAWARICSTQGCGSGYFVNRFHTYRFHFQQSLDSISSMNLLT